MFYIRNKAETSLKHEKEVNQDAFLVLEGRTGGGIGSERLLICGVLDGATLCCGSEAIRIAKGIMWKQMCKIADLAFDASTDTDFEVGLVRMFTETSDALNIYRERPVTTATFAVVAGNTIYCANAGDSPMYLFCDGKLRPLFECHNAAAAAFRSGLLSEREAIRSSMGNELTSALGRGIPKIYSATAELKGESLLLLSSDGVLGKVQEAELVEILQESSWLMSTESVAERLKQLTEKRTNDNQTLLIYHIDIT